MSTLVEKINYVNQGSLDPARSGSLGERSGQRLGGRAHATVGSAPAITAEVPAP